MRRKLPVGWPSQQLLQLSRSQREDLACGREGWGRMEAGPLLLRGLWPPTWCLSTARGAGAAGGRVASCMSTGPLFGCIPAVPLKAARARRDSTGRILPHGGGSLVNLLVSDSKQRAELIKSCKHTKECSDRNACDVELLTVGGFTPLSGFMNKDVYEHVVTNMRWGLAHLRQGLLAANIPAVAGLQRPSVLGLCDTPLLLPTSDPCSARATGLMSFAQASKEQSALWPSRGPGHPERQRGGGRPGEW